MIHFSAEHDHRLWQLPRVLAFLAMVFCLSAAGGLTAQDKAKKEKKDPARLTLERIFSSSEFQSQRYASPRWLDNGSEYTALEDSVAHPGSRDIVRVRAQSGEKEVVVSAAHLIPPGESSPLRIEGYQWSRGQSRVLIYTNSKRVWRTNSRGDYWVLDVSGRELRKLGGDAPPASLSFAKFSPNGRRVAYVRDRNIYVEDLEERRIWPLTQTDSPHIINGTFDWVYEEELRLRDGFRWSPDSKSIAYWQLNTEGVRHFHMINNTDGLYPRLIPFEYPKVGEKNSAGRVGVIGAGGGNTRWMRVPGDPRNHYIARMDWAENSDELVLQQLNRLQNTNRVMLADVAKGEVRTIFTDRDKAWVDVHGDVRWLDKGKRFLWTSERDGWRHVYVVSRSGGAVKLITPGKFDVHRIVGVDEKRGYLYFLASPDNPTQRYLFRAPLAGGPSERLTPADQPGSHSYSAAPGARWAVNSYSSFDTPSVTELIRLPRHRRVRLLADNAKLREKLDKLDLGPTEFFRVEIEKDVALDGWCIKPPKFDPKKKYPLLFYVYGEPAGATVVDRYGGSSYLWYQMFAQQGYLVMSVDNRGTDAPRGRDWRKIIYRQVGILASADQAAATRAIIKSRPYVDADRIGIWGWSGGGSMTLNAMFRYPDLYRTGMAVASVSNQRFYDTIYQERYMGLPRDNVDGYRKGSPITYARQLKGNLLLVHGTADDNVHYQSLEAVANELIAANKYFSMMAYPNRTHSIREGKNTRRHLYELLTRYLRENLPPGPR